MLLELGNEFFAWEDPRASQFSVGLVPDVVPAQVYHVDNPAILRRECQEQSLHGDVH
jgi:hypothetical protein